MAGALYGKAWSTVSLLQKFRESWLRPALFFGNNPISLAGGAITTASCATMLSYWMLEYFGRLSENPYLGIIFFLVLPFLFIAGLVLIPIGVFIRHRKLRAAGLIPAEFPKIDLNDRIFRRGLDIVLVATIVNLLVVATASYRGAAYMDSPEFCGQSCHVMHPEYTAYKIAAHSHVDCVECHIGSGAQAYFSAKVNGTKQLMDVAFDRYPTPIPSPVTSLRPARLYLRGVPHACTICRREAAGQIQLCRRRKEHRDADRAGAPPGGPGWAFASDRHSRRSPRSHRVHRHRSSRTTIPWVQKRNADGSETVFSTLPPGSAPPQGERRVMDCIDCHNRAAHPFVTAEEAINQAMSEGPISPNCPGYTRKAWCC